jgi:hypothetical protein
MPLVNPEQLLSIKLAEKTVEVSELGGELLLREMDVATRGMYERSLRDLGMVDGATVDKDKWSEFYPALVVAFAIVGDDGRRLYASTDGVRQLSGLPSRVIEPLFQAADALSGASPTALAAAKKN